MEGEGSKKIHNAVEQAAAEPSAEELEVDSEPEEESEEDTESENEDKPLQHTWLEMLTRPGPPYAIWMNPAEFMEFTCDSTVSTRDFLVGRVHHCGHILPVHVDLARFCAEAYWEGNIETTQGFEVLVVMRGNAEWVAASEGEVPAQAFPVGMGPGAETVYVGRVFLDGHWRLGRVLPSEGACVTLQDGEEVAVREYEVLVITL